MIDAPLTSSDWRQLMEAKIRDHDQAVRLARRPLRARSWAVRTFIVFWLMAMVALAVRDWEAWWGLTVVQASAGVVVWVLWKWTVGGRDG